MDENRKLLINDLSAMKESIAELRKLETPINSILIVRKKLVGYFVLLLSLVTTIWYALLPLVRLLAEAIIKVWFNKGGG